MINIQNKILKQQTRAIHRGFGLAIAIHVLLMIVIPSIPKLAIPPIDRGRVLMVFLPNQEEKPEIFEQTLHDPRSALASNTSQTLSSKIAQKITGKEAQNRQQTPEVNTFKQDNIQRSGSSLGSKSSKEISVSAYINRSIVRLFTDQEAVIYADKNPNAVQRFNRSFASKHTHRYRARTENTQNSYGDYYLRATSSSGDICFKQQKVMQRDEFNTNTVLFFRCDKGPMKLELDKQKKTQMSH